MPEEKRRSQRVKLSIPLRVQGVDDAGTAYECEARTVDLNRHGARIQISRPLLGGQVIRVTNVANRREANFRVAGDQGRGRVRSARTSLRRSDQAPQLWSGVP